MGFTVSGLSDYTNQTSTKLMGKLFFEGRTAQYTGDMPGVKFKEALQIVDVTGYPQDGAGCSFLASGDVAFTQRVMTVAPVKYQDTLCPDNLRVKWTQLLLKSGSNPEDANEAFYAWLTNEVIMTAMNHKETCSWQGDTASGNPILNKYDGFIKIIDAATTASAAAVAYSEANAITIVTNCCNARPAALLQHDNQVLYCGTDFFDLYINKIISTNYFHIDASVFENYTFTIPGKNVTLVGVNGLDGTQRLFLSYVENMIKGYDLMNDFDQLKMWYSDDDQNVKYNLRFKYGVQVARPEYVVEFTGS